MEEDDDDNDDDDIIPFISLVHISYIPVTHTSRPTKVFGQ